MRRNQQRTRPTKILPTDRITFVKQLDLLRAYAAASGPTGKVVTNKDAADIVKMNVTTTSLANAFFLDVGFLQKRDGGFAPSPEVVSFSRAYEWNPETATHKLGPLLPITWFGEVLLPKLTFSPIEESEAIRRLAEAAAASPDYKKQVSVLLDYLKAAGLTQQDGTQIKIAKTAPQSGPPVLDRSAPSGRSDSRDPQAGKSTVSTVFAQPTEGVVQFHVSVRVDMGEFAGWQPERITSFFAGIAQVLAAKGAIEKEASEET